MRDEFLRPDIVRIWETTQNRDSGSLKSGAIRLEVGDVVQIRGEETQRRVTYVMGLPGN